MLKGGDNRQSNVVGFDLDGTIIDMTGLKMELARERGFTLQARQTASGVINGHLPEQVLKDIQPLLYHTPELAVRPTLMPGVLSVLERLEREQVPFVLISRRKTPDVAKMTLRHHGLWPRFFREDNAHFVLTQEDKNFKSVALGVTHYVDDEPDTLEKMPDVPYRILYDPYGVLAHVRRFTRAASWPEIEKLIF